MTRRISQAWRKGTAASAPEKKNYPIDTGRVPAFDTG